MTSSALRKEAYGLGDPVFSLSKQDPAVYEAIFGEFSRLSDGIELIASENVVSEAVLAAQGSVLTNKYAEGYPGRRYYGGCEHVDIAEELAIERARQLFGCAFANVQPPLCVSLCRPFLRPRSSAALVTFSE